MAAEIHIMAATERDRIATAALVGIRTNLSERPAEGEILAGLITAIFVTARASNAPDCVIQTARTLRAAARALDAADLAANAVRDRSGFRSHQSREA